MLVIMFLLLPLAELYVFVQATHQFGFLASVGLMLAISVLGAGLVKRQGMGIWRRLNENLGHGTVPTKEIVDGFLVLLAGALLLTPGFITDAVGLLLLLPPVRAVVRAVSTGRFERMAKAGRVIKIRHNGPIDADAWESRREMGRGQS